jgi:hypothetical protein
VFTIEGIILSYNPCQVKLVHVFQWLGILYPALLDDKAMRDRTCCGAPGVTSLPRPALTMIGGQRFGVTTADLGIAFCCRTPLFVRAVVVERRG